MFDRKYRKHCHQRLKSKKFPEEDEKITMNENLENLFQLQYRVNPFKKEQDMRKRRRRDQEDIDSFQQELIDQDEYEDYNMQTEKFNRVLRANQKKDAEVQEPQKMNSLLKSLESKGAKLQKLRSRSVNERKTSESN